MIEVEALRPRIRLVVDDSYSGICNRIRTKQ